MIPKRKLAAHRRIMPELPAIIDSTVKRLAAASGSESTLRTYAQKPNLSRLEVLREAVAKSDLRHLLQQDVLYALDELARFKTAQNH